MEVKEKVKKKVKEKDTKEDTKEDVKENAKEDVKEDAKEDVKEDVKEDAKEDAKKTEIKKVDDYSYFKLILKIFKLLCFQVLLILLTVLLYVNLYNDNIYDFVIYFCFGLFIALLFISTLVLIKKLNITSSKKYMDKYASSIMINLCKKYLYLCDKNTALFIAIFDLSWHLLVSIIAFIYAKKYIKKSKKTNNTLLISFILFIVFCLFNTYINDAFRIYNKSLEISKGETNTIIITITLTYGGLLYYFDTIKNEKVEFINKFINK